MKLRVESGWNGDRMGNRVMPLYRTEVWLGDKWLATARGWKADETEAYAIELAHERIEREGLTYDE